MSYIPERDREDLADIPPYVWDGINALADCYEAEARRGVHEDLCNCKDPSCTIGAGSSPLPHEVLASAYRDGLLSIPQAPLRRRGSDGD